MSRSAPGRNYGVDAENPRRGEGEKKAEQWNAGTEQALPDGVCQSLSVAGSPLQTVLKLEDLGDQVADGNLAFPQKRET